MTSIVLQASFVHWTYNAEKTLLDFYKDHESLWQPKHIDYYVKEKKRKLLDELCSILRNEYPSTMEHVSDEEIKRKFKNLRAYFQRELKKVKRQNTSSNETCTSKWPHYNDCIFLADIGVEHNFEGPDDPDLTQGSFTEAEEFEEVTNACNAGTEFSPPEVPLDDDLPEFKSEPAVSVDEVQSQDEVHMRKNLVPPTKKRKTPEQEEKYTRLALLAKIAQSVTTQISQKEPSATEHFCLSLVEPLSLLKPLQREKAKLEIQSIIVNYLEENNIQ